ncbi:bifunctional biotin--[acetyl-CoA-carboxylase] synthetase/biotin operon repressor [Calidifontibacillus oryziterrae]|uniref:bifunctional biotin--[acetyl-CoA-carboxylase] synthetase/biotin operon repressor n=1 Tax=Calidifontibacillus oryziterrae TaxID=1191699 RepID=UPI0003055440|nr:bifunctional biotin--[acetyl-CoA-carboxylase] synthetase/biotin operon repressor [Calidifontibacillus oryziterrae]
MQSTIRKQLLKLFSDHDGEFLSGQMLSEALGCSRTAIWKHIEDLRKDGFELEAVQRKGYRILSKPDRLSGNEIQLGLKTNTFGRFVHYEESVPSTRTIAHKLSYEGAPEGAIVVAEEQVAGRGRLDRSWFSPKYSGIWFHIILRPNIPPQQAPQLTLLAAVSVVRGIKAATGIQCEIKWPNDILLNGKKLVGILTELQAETDQIHAVIIGIGINVNQQPEHFPDDLKKTATSLAIEKGTKLNRSEILQAILKEMENLYSDYLENGFQVVKLLWESHAVSIGKQITARTFNGTLTGKALGITDDGVLLLQDHHGKIHHIYSADIEII